MAVLLPAVQYARAAARRTACTSNMRQMGLALHAYEGSHGCLPAGLINGGYSTFVALLPFVEQGPLFQQIDFSHGEYDAAPSPPGSLPVYYIDPVRKTQVPLYRCPADPRTSEAALISYAGNAGTDRSGDTENGLFRSANHSFYGSETSHCVRVAEVTDGLSNTAAMAEVLTTEEGDPRGRRFTARTSYPLGQRDAFIADCLSLPIEASSFGFFGQRWTNGSISGTRYNHLLTPNTRSCTNSGNVPSGLWAPASEHGGGINLLLADGAVRFVNDAINSRVWRGLGTVNGGEGGLPLQ